MICGPIEKREKLTESDSALNIVKVVFTINSIIIVLFNLTEM